MAVGVEPVLPRRDGANILTWISMYKNLRIVRVEVRVRIKGRVRTGIELRLELGLGLG